MLLSQKKNLDETENDQVQPKEKDLGNYIWLKCVYSVEWLPLAL